MYSHQLFPLQSCGIFELMSDAGKKKHPGCSGSLLNLMEDCQEPIPAKKINQHTFETCLESDLILNRAAIQKHLVDEETSVCRRHKSRCGKLFVRIITKSCACPDHVRKLQWDQGLEPMKFDMSQEMMTKCSFTVACDDWICSSCLKMVSETIKNYQTPMEESASEEMESSDNPSVGSNVEWSGGGAEEGGSNSNPIVPLAKKGKEIAALNTFLTESGFPELTNRLDVSSNYDTVSPQYRAMFKRALTYTILAALRAISDLVSNQNKLFQDTKRSRRVEKGLGMTIVAPDDVLDVIRSYNGVSGYLEKRQVLTLIVGRYKYDFLKRFNRNQAGAGDQESICWQRPLTRHQYKKAKLQLHWFGFGMAKVIKEARRCSRVDELVIDAIFDFITSHQITQQVAYGE